MLILHTLIPLNGERVDSRRMSIKMNRLFIHGTLAVTLILAIAISSLQQDEIQQVKIIPPKKITAHSVDNFSENIPVFWYAGNPLNPSDALEIKEEIHDIFHSRHTLFSRQYNSAKRQTIHRYGRHAP